MYYEMAFNGSRTLNFPIGENDNWRYVTLNLAHNSGTSYTYIGQVIGSSAMALGYIVSTTMNHVSYQRYTQIDRVLTSTGVASNAGLNGNQAITMRYDANDVVNDYTNLTIAKTTGSGTTWMDIGGTASGNTTGTIISTSSPGAFISFSKFSLANKYGGGNPLPIELLYFKASPCNAYVCLDWSTATETKNDFFSVEKSSDALNFETVGTLKGAGNSSSALLYTLEDQHPYTNTSYYRLKQTDLDGQSKYYKTIAITLSENNPELFVFPNPNNSGKFIFKTKEQGLEIQLKNSFGVIICPLQLTSPSQEVDLSYLPGGVYFISVKKTGLTLKLVISK